MWDALLIFFGWTILEAAPGLMFRGPGFLICRLFRCQVEYDDDHALVVGILLWVIVIVSLFAFFAFK